MVFTSPTFLFAFLPLVLFVYYVSPNSIKNLILLCSSLFFYAWGEVVFIYVLLISIGLNYIFGRFLASFNHKKSLLFVGVSLNLALLIYYKYYHFIVLNLGINPEFSQNIHLPLGISFFTFQALSYLVDVKKGQCKPQNNIINLGLYIAFFPQLIAGPIVRYHNIAKQIMNRVHNNALFVSGVERFAFGLAKKLLIANSLGAVADPIFALQSDQISQSLAWLAIICYALQIYFDFSAYSDMAIGLGRMFGFKFQENFNYPYVATSIREFWQRWHISLSRWFRDYLYIPLGGNKKSKVRTYLNLYVVFILCGLWHGAHWNFLIWGLIHGSFLVLERLGFNALLSKIPRLLSHFYVLFVVIISWVFFRIETFDGALNYLDAMFNFNDSAHYIYTYEHFINNQFIVAFISAIVLCMPIFKKFVTYYPAVAFSGSLTASIQRTVLIFVALSLSFIMVSASTYNPFLYFRF